jgi:predicted phosphate transport protein (TIGR00153 family)
VAPRSQAGGLRLFGRNGGGKDELFALFREAGANAARAAELLDELMRTWPDDRGLQREVLLCEQEGDRITHDVIHRLHRSRHVPLDGGDLFALASAIDDVVDYTEEAADFLGLYQVEAPMEQAQQLTGVLREASGVLADALGRLSHLGDLSQELVEVNRLENEGDRISREAIASLFAGGIDPIVIIRWKDVFDRLEQAIDACEHVAHILEGLMVKHS